MNRLLFNREEYNRVYNCSMKTPEEWYIYGRPNVFLGTFFIASGIIYETFYISALIVMLKPEFFKISSYKMMFTVGVIDALTLIEICFMDGYDTIVGGVFCTAPTRYYIFGILSSFGWYSGTLIGVLLAFNRCMEILAPYYAHQLFDGKRTWVWLSGCFVFGFYTIMFEYPLVYNSQYISSFLDPHVGDEYSVPIPNPVYYTHTVIVAFGIAILYIILCIGWKLKHKDFQSAVVNKTQCLVNIQSFMISMEIMGTGLIYIYFYNFYVPDFCFALAHILWQMTHGDTGIFYFIVNKSVRTNTISMCKKIFLKSNKIISSNQAVQTGNTKKGRINITGNNNRY